MVALNDLDTNLLVSLLVGDALIPRATDAMSRLTGDLVVSDFAVAEFTAVIGRLVRIGQLDDAAGQSRLATFDVWVPQSALLVSALAADIATATTMLRQFDLNLRAPDALHIAMARRLDATLVTFDRRMEQAARSLGVATEGIVP